MRPAESKLSAAANAPDSSKLCTSACIRQEQGESPIRMCCRAQPDSAQPAQLLTVEWRHLLLAALDALTKGCRVWPYLVATDEVALQEEHQHRHLQQHQPCSTAAVTSMHGPGRQHDHEVTWI